MFGFKKKEPVQGFKELPEVRDCLKSLVGETLNVYVGVTVAYLTNQGKTEKKDVDNAKNEVITALQKYVQAEILLDRQKHGQEPSLTDIVFLKLR